jgi:hypothetical protein
MTFPFATLRLCVKCLLSDFGVRCWMFEVHFFPLSAVKFPFPPLCPSRPPCEKSCSRCISRHSAPASDFGVRFWRVLFDFGAFCRTFRRISAFCNFLPRNPFAMSAIQTKCVLSNFSGPWTAFVPPPPLPSNQKLKNYGPPPPNQKLETKNQKPYEPLGKTGGNRG